MPVTALPDNPGSARIGWSLIDFGGNQGGVLGGATQRVNRLGSRWRCEVTLPPMTPALAREWAAALASGRRNGVSWKVREPGTPAGFPGAVLVNGGGQAGFALAVDGATPGHVVRQGKWLSIQTGGRRYLHQAASTVTLDGSGAGTLAIEPALRAIPADNSPVGIAVPIIEGLLADVPNWVLDETRLVRGLTFAIEEAA
ncbi:hypothetical protein ACLBKU_12050 [Erythrobacter sp. NE805]|uniref:hypothetical protein n=1 Tax=Erythrobacter sp. NE805 TaxID=3389875 RepID=UPI00396B0E5A